MKLIKVNTSILMSAENGPVTLDHNEYVELNRQINYNKSQVISGVLTIEKELENIVAYFLFGHYKEGNKRKEFEGQILGSDWCSFSAKKKLVMYLINKYEYLSGTEKSAYDSSLRKVMSYRNAFTHGIIMITAGNEKNEVHLKYFEGGEKSVVLTDEYLSIIEKEIDDCFQLTLKVNKISGATVEQTI